MVQAMLMESSFDECISMNLFPAKTSHIWKEVKNMYRTYDYGVSFRSEEDSVWSKTLSGEDHLKGKPNATRLKGRKWKKARLALCLTKS
jgi:hypothetical protein